MLPVEQIAECAAAPRGSEGFFWGEGEKSTGRRGGRPEGRRRCSGCRLDKGRKARRGQGIYVAAIAGEIKGRGIGGGASSWR